MGKKYYHQGRAAHIKGVPYDPTASADWRDGWVDREAEGDSIFGKEYQAGWNACLKGKPLNRHQSDDWCQGWLECSAYIGL